MFTLIELVVISSIVVILGLFILLVAASLIFGGIEED